MTTNRVGALDDPVWAEPATVDLGPDLASPIAAWVLTMVGCVGLVAAIVLAPWIGLDQNLGRFNLTPSWTAIGPIPEASRALPFAPGTRDFGIAILFLAVAIATCDGVAIHRVRRNRLPRALAWVIEVMVTVCLIMVVLELRASPGFGDGPPLTFGWGAMVGLGAATLSVIGATVGLILVEVRVKRIRVAQGKTH